MIAWAMQQMVNINKEGLEILSNDKLSKDEQIALIKGANGTDIRLMNLFLGLQPAIEQAKEEYPEQTGFFEWFDDRWKLIIENNMIQGPCGCKGCK